MMPTPELSRRITTRSLGTPSQGTVSPGTTSLGTARTGAPGIEIAVEATPEECVRLARRLALPRLETFSCRFRLSPPDAAGQVAAEGLLAARLEQTCVVSLEDFPVSVAEQFSVRFVPAGHVLESADLELDIEADDDILYHGGMIDLGEAATEQLALALDPYPRKPGIDRPAGLTLGDPPPGGSPDPKPDGSPGGSVAERVDTDAQATEPDPERLNPFAALARLRRTDD